MSASGDSVAVMRVRIVCQGTNAQAVKFERHVEKGRSGVALDEL